MDPKLTSKELCSAVIDTLTLALAHERVDDAEVMLTCLRAMRPRIVEFDTFEAWILTKRGMFDDAIRILHNTAGSPHGGTQAKALMAYCHFAMGDTRWSDIANQVIDTGSDEDSSRLMRLLIDPGMALREEEEAKEAAELAAKAKSTGPASAHAVHEPHAAYQRM